ncbi:MAG: choice-of-anchor J domain-containing protein [Bacteroides sp.]|nr:choice-of-anchor J domain-containing protein [Bacteroides sp.]MCM1379504.1 choice-of-anchor J domain-containing protein [Bacteroides sp.]MCM1445893.1 choice-of-anchor J domain-containing protein [Prevotella sp.]
MKRFSKLLLGGGVALLLSALAPFSTSAKTTTIGAAPGNFFKSAQTSVLTQEAVKSVPAAVITPAKAPKKAEAETSSKTVIYGITQPSNCVSYFDITKPDDVKVKANLSASGQNITVGCLVGTDYHCATNIAYNMFNMLFIYRIDTWNYNGSNQFMSQPTEFVDLAYNSNNNTVYAIYGNGTAHTFGTLYIEGNSRTDIKNLSNTYVALAADTDNKLFAVSTNGKLYRIGYDGSEEEIGATGITPAGTVSSACFDLEDNTMYWAESSALYTIDTTSGAATKVTDLTGTWAGIYVAPPKPIITASWVDDLVVNFKNDETTGTISFTLPTKDALGNDLDYSEVDLDWCVEENGEEIISGTGKPGDGIYKSLTLTEGNHELVIYASVDGTPGMMLTHKRFVGHDTPCKPTGITVQENGNNVYISWNDVTTGVNDGYIFPYMQYNVVRQPDNKVIPTNFGQAVTVDPYIESMGYYWYEITANDMTNTSEVAVSETMLLGSALGVKPPFEFNFGKDGLGLFTTLNANNDKYEWNHDTDANIVWLYSNTEQASDDWLISPPIQLEAGAYNYLSMMLQGSNYLENQRYEIKMGKSPAVEDMTTTIHAESEFSYLQQVQHLIKTEETGKYYIGLHVTTPALTGAIAIANFTIGAPIFGAAPNVAPNMIAIAGEKGAKSVALAFDAPKETFDGETLESLTQITVKNLTTEKTLQQYTNPTPGERISLTDSEPALGENVYEVISSNSFGASPATTVSTWVGMDIPVAPSQIRWQQQGEKVTLSWTAPTDGAHKGYIDPEALTYIVIDPATKDTIQAGITGLSVELNPTTGSDQQIALEYAVAAVSETGTGAARRSNTAAFGKPYTTPFAESFELAQMHSSPWVILNAEGTNYMMPATDIMGLPITSYDDDAMLVYAAFSKGVTLFCFPVLDLSGLTNPALKFHLYNMDRNTTFSVVASDDSGITWKPVGQAVSNETINRWYMGSVDLSELAGKSDARIALMATSEDKGLYVCLDKFRIDSNADNDLMITDVVMPDRVQAGKTFTVKASAVNNGRKAIGAYTVDFNVNGTTVHTASFESLGVSAFNDIEAELPLSSNEVGLSLEIVGHLEGDNNETNNNVSTTAAVLRSRFPQPENLANESTDSETVELTWTAPATVYNATITDDFESLTACDFGGITADNHVGTIGAYKVIDNDKLPTTYTFGLSGLPNLGKPMSAYVMNLRDYPLETNVWAAHSGSSLICFWQTMDEEGSAEVNNDDYLILPELDPEDSYLSLWAKSITNKYRLSSFEIMVSFTGNELEDFMSFREVKEIPAGYASVDEHGYSFYEFDLPEGTKYAAIRCNMFDSAALLIDDITYTPADGENALTLKGYNVYRNGEKLTTTPMVETKFADKPEFGDHTYVVTSVFAEGESRFSNEVNVLVQSGIGELTANSAAHISVCGNKVVVNGLEGQTVSVYATDGRLIARKVCGATTAIRLNSGVYVVTAGNEKVSVAIK